MFEAVLIDLAMIFIDHGMIFYSQFDYIFSALTEKQKKIAEEVLSRNGINVIYKRDGNDDTCRRHYPVTKNYCDYLVETYIVPYIDNYSYLIREKEINSNLHLCKVIINGVLSEKRLAESLLYFKNKYRIYKLVNIYYEYYPRYDFEDLLQSGYMGLIETSRQTRAFNDFFKDNFRDPYWPASKKPIVSYIRHEAMKSGDMIRIPQYMLLRINRVVKAYNDLDGNGDKTLFYKDKIEYLSDRLYLPAEKINKALNIYYNQICYESLNINEGDNENLYHPLWDKDNLTLDELAIKSELSAIIRQILDNLTEREALVLRLLYGFIDGRCRNLPEVAKELNVTCERIHQIEAKALRKIRQKHIWLKEYW